jgi:hypothetical protein
MEVTAMEHQEQKHKAQQVRKKSNNSAPMRYSWDQRK